MDDSSNLLSLITKALTQFVTSQYSFADFRENSASRERYRPVQKEERSTWVCFWKLHQTRKFAKYELLTYLLIGN